jgi:hypothetical protein
MKDLPCVVADAATAAAAIAAGGISIQAFGNFYAIVSRPEEVVVRRVNLLKGRPLTQTGSIVTTRPHFAAAYDWARLPPGVEQRAVLALMDALFALGPLGFRGPAAAHVPDHLSASDAGVRTTQIIAPGYACPSIGLLARSLEAARQPFLYITSANRSHSLTGAAEEAAHYRADALAREFAGNADLILVRHADEPLARARFPLHAPMSTTVLAFHKVGAPDADGRPTLVVERHGSLPLAVVAPIAARHGFGLAPAPAARRRLAQRDYDAPAPSLAAREKTA